MDNGKGIPADVLSRSGEEGFSFGKSNGNGLGVHFAKRKMLEWGGDLQISSHAGRGTMVSLSFATLARLGEPKISADVPGVELRAT
jgi:signal transduction histidine kinase